MTPVLVRDGKLLCSVWRDHARVSEAASPQPEPILITRYPVRFASNGTGPDPPSPRPLAVSAPACRSAAGPGPGLPPGLRLGGAQR